MATLYTPSQELEIVKYESFAQLEQGSLTSTINASFLKQGKELTQDYFDITQPLGIYIVKDDIKGNYIAGAITKNIEALGDTVYLDKFFVHPDYEGNGIAKGLLRYVLEDIGIEAEADNSSSIILRTDPNNKKSNSLYIKEFFNHFGQTHNVTSSDGQQKWNVHEIGIDEDLENKVKFVADLPATMVQINSTNSNGYSAPNDFQGRLKALESL